MLKTQSIFRLALLLCCFASSLSLAQLPGADDSNFKPEDHLRKQAKKDDKKAQLELALCYLVGKYAVDPDADEAMHWLKQAASEDSRSKRKQLPPHPRALLYLGFCHENPMYAKFLDLEIDRKKALNYYLHAESKGYQEAAQYIAKTYRFLGKHQESVSYFKKAADLKIPVCQVEYAKLLLSGKWGVKRDPKAAVTYLKEAGLKGNSESFLVLADIYSGKFDEVPQDLDLMIDSLWQAASTRSDAMTRIGYCYLHGIGLPKDELLAFKWYQKAATDPAPDVNGRVALARCYSQGIGVDADQIKAFENYLIASSEPDAPPIADYNVALCYLKGAGVKPDTNQAFIFLNKAADEDYPPALVLLGSLYEQGKAYGEDDKPLPASPQKAFELYKKAADQGDMAGLVEVGRCYYQGTGTEVKKQEALKILRNAAQLESKEAIKLLIEFKEPLVPGTVLPKTESPERPKTVKPEAPQKAPKEAPAPEKPLMQF